jgi:hypothetical protein
MVVLLLIETEKFLCTQEPTSELHFFVKIMLKKNIHKAKAARQRPTREPAAAKAKNEEQRGTQDVIKTTNLLPKMTFDIFRPCNNRFERNQASHTFLEFAIFHVSCVHCCDSKKVLSGRKWYLKSEKKQQKNRHRWGLNP